MNLLELKAIAKSDTPVVYGILTKSYQRDKPYMGEYRVGHVGSKYVTLDGEGIFHNDKFHKGLNGYWNLKDANNTTMQLFKTRKELDDFIEDTAMRQAVVLKLRDMLSVGRSIPDRLYKPLARAIGVYVPDDEGIVIARSWDSVPPVVECDGVKYSTRVLADQHTRMWAFIWDKAYEEAKRKGAPDDLARDSANQTVDKFVKS